MNLSDAIIEYKTKDGANLALVKEIYEKASLLEAISNASTGVNHTKKMDWHQRRVGRVACAEGATELLSKISEIAKCDSFEQIFEITESVKVNVFRLGDLWSYDTALRIGFNLETDPKDVYIHCGVKEGVEKLNREYGMMLDTKKWKLTKESFGKEFADLKPYEIENFLCVWGKE